MFHDVARARTEPNARGAWLSRSVSSAGISEMKRLAAPKLRAPNTVRVRADVRYRSRSARVMPT